MNALVRRVTFDRLTGALTRRAGDEMLEAQFRHCIQNEMAISLAFFDIDRFKQVNDDFGHQVGDQVLRQFVTHLHRSLRHGDSLIRWGGEEFLVVMVGSDREGARIVVERLRQVGFGPRPDGQPLTASIGLAERVADCANDTTQLVELADRRMYEAKLGGRNCAVFGQGDVVANVIREVVAKVIGTAQQGQG
ncbi:MAG: GGDEF domain-containing protein, partial [Rhodospirillaceae bacterium]